jgi:signal transduction histidine kinase
MRELHLLRRLLKVGRIRSRIRDVSTGVALTVAALLPLGIPALELGELDRHPAPWLVMVLTIGQTLPVMLRTAAPRVVLTIVGLSFSGAQLLGADTGLAGLGVLIAAYSCGRHLRGRLAMFTAGIALASYVVLAAALAAAGSPERPVDWFTFSIVLAIPWWAGRAVREQRRRQQERERTLAHQAVMDARAAIARDLHDVVTHHVTAMVVQAESTAFSAQSGAPVDQSEALTAIGRNGREALQDLRGLLDTLDPVDVHQSASTTVGHDVVTLVNRLRATGYPVTLCDSGDTQSRGLVTGVLYDIAREALTNAMKHAPGVPVTCVISNPETGVVQLTIENDLQPFPGAPPIRGAGRGSRIMRQRAAEHGGEVRVGRTDRHSWEVKVRIPSSAHEADRGERAP